MKLVPPVCYLQSLASAAALAVYLIVAALPAEAQVGTAGGSWSPVLGIDRTPSWLPASIWTNQTILQFDTDPGHADTVYAATRGSGVWKSTDAGRSWVPKNAGLMNLDVDVLRFDSATNSLYVAQTGQGGASGGAVYRSVDRGESWQPVANQYQPLPYTSFFTDLDVSQDGQLWLTSSSPETTCGLVFSLPNGGAKLVQLYGGQV